MAIPNEDAVERGRQGDVVNPKLAGGYRDRFQALAAPTDRVHVIDVLPHFLDLEFKDRTRCFLSADDGHYSVRGHQVVATALLIEMAERGIVPAPAEAVKSDSG